MRMLNLQEMRNQQKYCYSINPLFVRVYNILRYKMQNKLRIFVILHLFCRISFIKNSNRLSISSYTFFDVKRKNIIELCNANTFVLFTCQTFITSLINDAKYNVTDCVILLWLLANTHNFHFIYFLDIIHSCGFLENTILI